MKICFLVKNNFYISRLLLEGFMKHLQLESVSIFALNEAKESCEINVLNYFRHFLFSFPPHPKYKKKISDSFPVTFIQSINNASALQKIVEFEPHVVILLGYPEILSEESIESLGLVINYHNSSLPIDRGVFATHRAMLREEEESGFTFHRVQKKIDTGAVFLQNKCKLDYSLSAMDNEIIKIQSAVESIPILLNKLQTHEQPIPQEEGSTIMSTNGFFTFLNELAKTDKKHLSRIIPICGGYTMSFENYEKCYVTKMSKAGKVLRIKGFPVWLYKVLHFFKLIR